MVVRFKGAGKILDAFALIFHGKMKSRGLFDPHFEAYVLSRRTATYIPGQKAIKNLAQAALIRNDGGQIGREFIFNLYLALMCQSCHCAHESRTVSRNENSCRKISV